MLKSEYISPTRNQIGAVYFSPVHYTIILQPLDIICLLYSFSQVHFFSSRIVHVQINSSTASKTQTHRSFHCWHSVAAAAEASGKKNQMLNCSAKSLVSCQPIPTLSGNAVAPSVREKGARHDPNLMNSFYKGRLLNISGVITAYASFMITVEKFSKSPRFTYRELVVLLSVQM